MYLQPKEEKRTYYLAQNVNGRFGNNVICTNRKQAEKLDSDYEIVTMRMTKDEYESYKGGY